MTMLKNGILTVFFCVVLCMCHVFSCFSAETQTDGSICLTLTSEEDYKRTVTSGVSISEYMDFGSTVLYRVLNRTEKLSGNKYTYTYGDVTYDMYWSDKYNAYVTLIFAASEPTGGTVGVSAGTAVDIDYGMDVNLTDKVDANDAQLIFNIYNGAYTDFEKVTAEKFLCADINGDAVVNVLDSSAIIASLLSEDISAYPEWIKTLLYDGLISVSDVQITDDGFYMLTKSVYDILTDGGVTSLENSSGSTKSIKGYSTWYLYSFGETCSLYKSAPSAATVRISFIEVDFDAFVGCIDGADGAKSDLYYTITDAIDTTWGDGSHTTVLTDYFKNAVNDGSYLIAERFVSSVASAASGGAVSVPSSYTSANVEGDKQYGHVVNAVKYLSDLHPGLITWSDGLPVSIRVSDPENLTSYEKQAVLCLYTMDITFCAFAGEVAAHAEGCDSILISLAGGYDSVKIADMKVGTLTNTTSLIAYGTGTMGFYNMNSSCVQNREDAHPEYAGEYDPSYDWS